MRIVNLRNTALCAAAAAAALALGTARANADIVLDLTAGTPVANTINGARFFTNDQQPTGTGVIDPFVRIQSNKTIEQGYNTDFRPLQFDENNTANYTRSLPVADLQVVNVGGTDYYKFLLDINQQDHNPLLTLNELEIWLGNAANLHNYSPDHSAGGTGFGANASLVYDLDTTTSNNRIELNYGLNSGSGSGDMYAYIPKANFTGTNAYVYLYSKFGDPNGNNDGFEEWAAVVGKNTPSGVPLPASLWGGLTLLGALGAAKIRSRRRSA